MSHKTFSHAVFVLLGCLVAASAAAQTNPTVRVSRPAVIMNSPRSDAFVVGHVAPGVILEVTDRSGSWFQVITPATAGAKTAGQRGWIHSSYTVLASGALNFGAASNRSRPQGKRLVRGFVEGGGTVFTATDSFESLFGNARGMTYGGGGQVALANGLLFQVSSDRFKETGTRALVNGAQVYRLSIPDTVTMTPIVAAIGYRQATSARIAGYFGAGGGWLTVKEESPGLATTSKRYVLGHLGVGAELMVVRGVWTAGEVQFRFVPKGLDPSGIGPVYEEANLGGTRFLFKILVGL
jgi:hypothetical protein